MPPVRHPREPDDPDAGTIVDPTVIAERRARRAELNEEALRERASRSETQLSEAHRQLDGAHEQRRDLAARLKQAERDLRAARQGEHAEAQRREEIEEDASAARREAEQQIARLRTALATSDLRVGELEAELERVHRTAAEAQQTARAALSRQDGGGHDHGRAADDRQGTPERERVSAEVILLQHELDRRIGVQEAVSHELVALRAELKSTQSRVSSDSVRKAVAESVLDDLGSTALALRDELLGLEDERLQMQRQLAAAQAQVDERDSRLVASAEDLAAAQAALVQVRDEFGEAAAVLRSTIAEERAAFESQIATIRDGVVELRERLVRTEAEAEVRVQVERDARLAAEQRAEGAERARDRLRSDLDASAALETLVRDLAGTAASLEQLKHERDAGAGAGPENAAAVAELARLQALVEQEKGAGARAEDRIVELEDELEQVRVTLRPLPPMPRADHPALKDAVPAGPCEASDGDSVIIDLARAAARLRTRRDDADDAPAGDVAGEPATVPAETLIASRAETDGPGVPRAWMTPSIMALARRDPPAAAAVIEALVAVQGARLERALTYDLLIAGHPALRVQLYRNGTSAVAPRTAQDPGDAASFCLSGSAIALAAYVGGGSGRRVPPGAAITGHRRRARRLARALRDPVDLTGLTAAGVSLAPSHLLSLLTGAIDLTATKGQRFTIAFAQDDRPAGVHIVVADGVPIAVRAGAPAHATAGVRTAPGALAGFLAGNESARVSGDVAVVQRLLAWVYAVQGLDG